VTQSPRNAPLTLRWARLGFSLLALSAIAVQFYESYRVRQFPAVNFFSFFTIQSNLFAAAVLLRGGSSGRAGHGLNTWNMIRGAAVLYMSITGVVYGLLLAGYQEALQTTIPWVDTVLHRLMPLVMVVDWLMDPPRSKDMTFIHCATRWAVYPLAYAGWSLLRGTWASWYPYPFLNPQVVGGYPIVVLYCLGIAAGSLAFVGMVAWLGRRCHLEVEGG
jgi:hypothetical protein